MASQKDCLKRTADFVAGVEEEWFQLQLKLLDISLSTPHSHICDIHREFIAPRFFPSLILNLLRPIPHPDACYARMSSIPPAQYHNIHKHPCQWNICRLVTETQWLLLLVFWIIHPNTIVIIVANYKSSSVICRYVLNYLVPDIKRRKLNVSYFTQEKNISCTHYW